MSEQKLLFLWANNDKTISVSVGSKETEVRMRLKEAKERFADVIKAAE